MYLGIAGFRAFVAVMDKVLTAAGTVPVSEFGVGRIAIAGESAVAALLDLDDSSLDCSTRMAALRCVLYHVPEILDGTRSLREWGSKKFAIAGPQHFLTMGLPK